MQIKCESCGEVAVDALQRAGGVNGLDFIRLRCANCGAERILHNQEAREAAAILDASNEPTNKETDESN